MADILTTHISAEQQPVRAWSRLDCAAVMYGDDALHAAWSAFLADVPMTWLHAEQVVL